MNKIKVTNKNITQNVPINSNIHINVEGKYTDKEIQENGLYKASDEGYTGFSSVSVEVMPKLKEKIITENGVYNASSEGVDGFSSVSVELPVIENMGPYVVTNDNMPFEVTDENGLATSTYKRQAFAHNKNLISVYNSKIKKIMEHSVFEYCKNLNVVNMPNLEIIYGSSAFSNCTSLNTVNMPNLETISGSSTFSNCTSLNTVNMPNLRDLSSSNCFSSCKKIKNLKFESLKTVSNYASYAFGYCENLESIEFFNLEYLSGAQLFRNSLNLKKIIIKSENIPIISYATFLNSTVETKACFVYVPDELVEGYKTAEYWINYASQIKGLSELE